MTPSVVLNRPSPSNVPPVMELSWQLGVGGGKGIRFRSPSSLQPCWTAFLSILLVRWREHCDHAQRAASTTSDFHRQGDHVESPMRKIA
jgi:hypothetical protein